MHLESTDEPGMHSVSVACAPVLSVALTIHLTLLWSWLRFMQKSEACLSCLRVERSCRSLTTRS